MNPQDAYDLWATQYDTNENKTRDLEAKSLRETLASISFDKCLELGCGTGKNTEWLLKKAKQVTAVDYSEQMLKIAKEKIASDHVHFMSADLNQDWPFGVAIFDIVIFSLVLEHIQDLDTILQRASQVLKAGGLIYIGELHPFKQYTGSKARFETNDGPQIVECFIHHISDFIDAGEKNGLALRSLKEYFDDGDRNSIPRILSMLLMKAS